MSPLLLLLLLLLGLSTSSTPTTLPLHRLRLPHPDPLQRLAALSSASVLRAQLLKSPKKTPTPSRSPLAPHSYGGYSVLLSIGSPPQTLPLLLDTGSDLSWIPCTKSYLCRTCRSPSIPTFIPKSSSSSKLIGCGNPKCLWIHPQNSLSCPKCPSDSPNCPQICPPYLIIYGSGSTAGLFLSETLRLPNRTTPDFALGCSLVSDRQPSAGVAAFGRGPASIPSQLRLNRFSYCLISRRFDDAAAASGSLVLDGPDPNSGYGAGPVRFTPFLKNPASPDVFSVYYYVGLHKITVGGEKVKIPQAALVPGSDGSGGTIVDSGTTITYMASPVFEPLVAAFVSQIAWRFNRSAEVEDRTGLRPCFGLPGGRGEVDLPEMVFHFKGGAEMRLPLENYFVFAGASPAAAVCLIVVSDVGPAAAGTAGSGGPSIILGNFQQQNYYMVYDLEKGRLGFRQQSCIRT